jgi:hypothetical protein
MTPRGTLWIAARLSVLGLLLGPGTLLAQTGPATQPQGSKWWAGGGGGYLAGHVACSNCDTDRPYGDDSAFLVQGGRRVTERLLIGGEVFSTVKTHSGGDFRDTHLLGIAQFRPFAHAGFFLKGGYGMAVVKAAVPLDSGGTSTARTWGMGVMYGAGWVFGEGRRVSFAPVAATYITTVGDISMPAGTATNVVMNGWFAGAAVMFR